jgi:hypothetical protein
MRSRLLLIQLAIATFGCAAGNEGGVDEPDAARPRDAASGGPDARREVDAAETFDPVPDAAPADAGYPTCATRVWVNLLDNGDLDAGPAIAWTAFSERGAQVITADAPLTPHTPAYVAWLAGYALGHEQIWQTVTVPLSATKLRFRGRGCFVTDEATFGTFDWSTVSLHDSATLGLLEVLVDVTNEDAGGTCDFVPVQATAASAFPGRTIDVLLEGMNDDELPTSFWWDSLALEAYVCL